MTRKRPHRTDRSAGQTRAAIEAARLAAEQAAATDEAPLDLDPASRLFFEFAAPLLLTARNEVEFEAAASLAEFVWSTTHFDAASQVLLLDDFIQQTQVPDEMIPWLLEVYAELADRKHILLGE